MNPTTSDKLVNAPLTQVAQNVAQDARNFIAARVFPVVPVDAPSGSYYTQNRGDWFRAETRERAPSTESVGSGFRLGQAAPAYNIRIFAVHMDIDDQTRRTLADQFDLERQATNWVTHQLLLFRERYWADSFFRTGIWTRNFQGVAAAPAVGQFLRWNDAASDPVFDVSEAAFQIAEETGQVPNVLVLSPRVYNALKNHPIVQERVKFTQAANVTEQLLAGLFEVERVLIPRAIINTGAEGAADNFGNLYGRHALLVHATDNPSLINPDSGGYIFNWRAYPGANYEAQRIKQFRLEEINSDRIEGEIAFDTKIVNANMGAFFADAVA